MISLKFSRQNAGKIIALRDPIFIVFGLFITVSGTALGSPPGKNGDCQKMNLKSPTAIGVIKDDPMETSFKRINSDPEVREKTEGIKQPGHYSITA